MHMILNWTTVWIHVEFTPLKRPDSKLRNERKILPEINMDKASKFIIVPTVALSHLAHGECIHRFGIDSSIECKNIFVIEAQW